MRKPRAPKKRDGLKSVLVRVPRDLLAAARRISSQHDPEDGHRDNSTVLYALQVLVNGGK